MAKKKYTDKELMQMAIDVMMNNNSPFVRHFGELKSIFFINKALLATCPPKWRIRNNILFI